MHAPKPEKLTDTSATIVQLKTLVDQFVQERGWSQYHLPKNLAMSIAIEAAELMEHFQWVNPSQPLPIVAADSPIAQELSDVIAYCLALANVLKIDISEALESKMKLNQLKYPVGVEFIPKGISTDE